MTKQELYDKWHRFLANANDATDITTNFARCLYDVLNNLDEPRECKVVWKDANTGHEDDDDEGAFCSLCDCYFGLNSYGGFNFCPNCGAQIKRGAL